MTPESSLMTRSDTFPINWVGTAEERSKKEKTPKKVAVDDSSIQSLHTPPNVINIKNTENTQEPKPYSNTKIEKLIKEHFTSINKILDDKLSPLNEFFEKINEQMKTLSNQNTNSSKNRALKQMIPASALALFASTLMNIPGDIIGKLTANHILQTNNNTIENIIPKSQDKSANSLQVNNAVHQNH